MTPSPAPWADDVRGGAAAGLLPGGLVLGAPLLGAVVGMPGAAVRYVLLTAALLCVLGAGVVFRFLRGRPVTPRTAARCALLACLLNAAAGLWPSVPVYCAAVLGGALLGAPGLRLFRATPAWCASGLAGLGAAGALTGWLAEHPGAALAACGAAGAALLTPLALHHRGEASDNAPREQGSSPDTAIASGAVSAAPRTGPTVAADATRPPHAQTESGTGGTPPEAATRSATIDAAALTAAAAAAFFAAQDLLVFRRLELGGAPAALTGAAALAAALVPAALLARPGGGTRGPAPVPRDPALPLLLLAVAAASAALAAAADTRQLVVSLALALGCAAAGVSTLWASGFRGTALPALLGGLAGIGTVALAGRFLDAGDALALASALPLGRAALLLRGDRAARRAGLSRATPPTLEVRRLTVRHKNRPRVTRLRLSVAPGELVVLHDGLPGRRGGAALRAMAGIPRASPGRCTILGHDPARTDAATRWRLGLCALLDPHDGAVTGALPQLASPTSVSGALRAAVAPLDAARADELCRAAHAAFPFLAARGDDPPAALEPAERCVLGLALTLIARPRLLLLDLTGPGTPQLAADPDVADLLRRITAHGTAVLVATTQPSPVLGGRTVGLSTGRRAPRAQPVPRRRKAST
ncbi:hypothetical protein OHB05_41765 [Streptomyces sp. NBC_00638]|uniref:hypothetical protein n=1 Tax=Streptomyces sp. NBC_00638 TaxID=2975794 RepID=UPI002256F8A3|nr:hypothetical protein [Streptomyces sp. NBC_00638]MCX5009049.1 hypothetical protein [Streptomyces sp. NBC_00638]